MIDVFVNLNRSDDDELFRYLKARFNENDLAVIKPSSAIADTANLIEEASNCLAVVSGAERWTRTNLLELYEKTPVRLITRMGTGVDNIDTAAAHEYGIYVSNTPAANAEAVAEGAVALMLAVQRKIAFYDRRIRDGKWKDGDLVPSLKGKTIGIIGYGHIGKLVARFLSGFSCKFLVYDPYQKNKENECGDIRDSDLDFLIKESDVISIHVPLTADTEHLVNKKFLAKMKPESIIINTSRGGVINEVDLIQALEQGIIAGAGLDVFENEPHVPDALIRDNTVLTPHVLSATRESVFRSVDMLTKNILTYLSGKPSNLIN